MIRILLVAFFILRITHAFSAGDEYIDSLLLGEKNEDRISPFDFFLGKKVFRDPFYNKLANFENLQPADPITFIGFSVHGKFIYSDAIPFFGHINVFNYYLPQSIKVDSTWCRIGGFQTSISLYGVNIIPEKKKLDIIFSIGITGGRMKLKEKGEWKMKNGLFAPMGSMCIRYEFKNVVLGWNSHYDYDITSSEWKKTLIRKEAPFEIHNFNQSGLSTYLFFGIKLK